MNINFFCVGAQKAGTTTLHDILIQHPQIFLPETKEAHFFDEDEKYEKGLNWYEKTFFSNYKAEKIVGSCNPEYMYFEDVPKRIYDTIGSDIKFVFILRNPMNRAYSHYLMSKRRYYEELTFEEAILEEEERIKKNYFNKTHFSYVSRGYYSEQVKRYLKYFPKKNMLFIRFEDDLIKNRKETIDELMDFLNINKINLNIDLRSNVARSSRFKFVQRFIYKKNFIKDLSSYLVTQKFKNRTRKYLHDIFMKPEKNNNLDNGTRIKLSKLFSNDIIQLEKIIGKNLDSWNG